MLKIIYVQSSDEKWQRLTSLDLSKQTILVSDLRSKKDLVDFYLNQQGFVEHRSILRMSEFWTQVLLRTNPEYQVVRKEWLILFLKKYLKETNQYTSAGVEEDYLGFFNQVSSILFHPNGIELIEDYILEKEIKTKIDWIRDLPKAKEILEVIIDNKYLLANWIPNFLAGEGLSGRSWDRSLTIDLGCQLTRAEAEIFKNMSERNSPSIDVQVLFPILEQSDPWLLRPYQILDANFFKNNRYPGLSENPKKYKNVDLIRVPSIMAEVDETMQRIEQFILSGVNPKQISIVSSNVEKYWPFFSSQFLKLGIPIEKSIQTRLHSFPIVHRWLSLIRIACKSLSYVDLSVFAEGSKCSSSQFEAFFQTFVDAGDLDRWLPLKNQVLDFVSQYSIQNGQMTAAQFSELAIDLWKENFTNAFSDTRTEFRAVAETPNLLLRELLSFSQGAQAFPVSDWLAWLEKWISVSEVSIASEDSVGIHFRSVFEEDLSQSTHVIFIGVTEKQIATGALAVSGSKARKISHQENLYQDLGFSIDVSESSPVEFQLDWLLNKTYVAVLLIAPATDWEGSADSPAPLFLMIESIQEKVADEAEFFKAEPGKEVDHILEMNLPKLTTFAYPPEILSKFSYSGLQTLDDCGFQFYASRALRLEDPYLVDIELDPRPRGTLFHALLDEIAKDLVLDPFDVFSEKLKALIEKDKVVFYDEFSRNAFIKKSYKMTQRFFEFEIEKRKLFPNIKTLASEKSFSFELQTILGPVVFQGRIDRVDYCEATHQVIIFDYKSTAGSWSSWKTWNKKRDWQLYFYKFAVDQGALDDLLPGKGRPQVAASLIYDLRETEHKTGFVLSESWANFIEKKPHHTLLLKEEEESGLDQAFRAWLDEVLMKARDGNVEAKPSDETICERCAWRTLCRANHLS